MKITRSFSALALIAMVAVGVTFAAKTGTSATTSQFQGPKANTGTAMFFQENGKSMLKVSDDFKVPEKAETAKAVAPAVISTGTSA